MASMMLRRGGDKGQLALDLRLSDGTKTMEARWRDASENEKKSRARFAQNAMKPQEIAPEWEKVRGLLGSPGDARQFIQRSLARFGVPLDARKNVLVAHVHALEAGLKTRLAEHDLTGSIRLATSEPAPAGTSLLTRTHPLTSTLAEALVEASLDSEAMAGLGIGRVGAWPTTAVERLTRIALLRVRFKLTVHARKERLLLAEEAALVALQGHAIFAHGDAARRMLDANASGDLALSARDRFISQARQDLPGLLDGPIAEFARSRADELMKDHARLRAAAGSASRMTVEAVLPPDVIGLFVLMPSGD
jgi:hypothetical protein